MHSPELWDDFDEREDTVFRDVILLSLAGFIAIVVLLLPYINPVGSDEQAPDDPPGNVIVELFWDSTRDVDLDLWVDGPNDTPVGYSNQGGVYFNLLRDDLGKYKDSTPINYEVAFSRGIAAGEYIVNAHFYRFDAPSYGAIEAKVVVTVVDPNTKARHQVLETDVAMTEEGQERTAVRFELTGDGKLVPNTINNEKKSIRGAWPK